MLFNSWLFAVFFVLVYLAYLRLSLRGQNWLLLLGSYLFYACWDWRFLSLILLSTAVDYVCGLRIADSGSARVRRACLLVSMVVNLGLLAAFKYFDFFAGNLEVLLRTVGLPVSALTLGIVVPVGISFYTFQTMSYTIDLYRGQVDVCRNLRDFALYVAFFPQLVAGPIERGEHFLPQVRGQRVISTAGLQQGLWWILLGYFFKVYLADNLAPMVDAAFSSKNPSGMTALVGTYGFAFQIYGDFAGYSLIARGVAKLMGFDLVENFRVPYIATSPSEFWTRWHISLSSWLRDYLYIPLGGNRCGASRTYVNLMTTMLLGGLWHGAQWKFVLWGLFHGGLLIAFRAIGAVWPQAWRLDAAPTERRWLAAVTRGATAALFFQITCMGWIIFRCERIEQIWLFPYRMFADLRFDPLAWEQAQVAALLIGPVMLIDLASERYGTADFVLHWPRLARAAVYFAMLTLLALLGARGGEEFIYFQF